MRLLRAAVACVGLLVSVLAAAGSAGAAAGGQTYLQFNMCGNACNHGGMAVVHNLAGTIAASRPFAVTLNEVCENQYDRLRAGLRAYDGRFDPTGPMCGNGSRYGNAILVRAAGVELVGSWQLPNPAGDETRRLMCVSARALVVCVTHISYRQGNIAAQVGAVAGILRGLGGAPAVLLGGDFNAEPADPRLDPLSSAYHGTGTGIDNIFLGGGRWSTVRARAIDAARDLSDHAALWATGTLRG